MSAIAGVLQVLVVDDHEIVPLGVRQLLGERARVEGASTLALARARLAEQPFDLLLLDLALGDTLSLSALASLRESAPEMRVIVLTSMAESLYAERALAAGADGFVMKSELADTLAAAIDTVMAGGVHLSTAAGSALLRRAGRPVAEGRPQLSTREAEVLRLIAAGRSTREIAQALNRSVKTVETHKQSLKAKLGAGNATQLMRAALAWNGEPT